MPTDFTFMLGHTVEKLESLVKHSEAKMQVEKTVFILSVDDVDDYNSVSEDEFNNNQLHWEVFQKIFKNANHICNNLINTKNIVFNFLSHGNVDENHSFNYLLKQSDCLNIENPEVSLTLSADSIASTKSWISREFHATSRLEDFIFNCKSKNRGAIQLNLLFDMDYENEGTLVQVGFGARIIERFSAEKNMSEVIQQVTICYGGYDEVEDEIQREPHSMGTHTFSKALLKTLQNIKAQVVEFDSKQCSVVPLIRGLGPGYLRFGGTAADRTYFVDPSSLTKDITNITYNGLTG
uniref:Uncharacterized protein n=1 Tax=Acrobeloides nanus TaxID=290746 RepID=A0A914CY90_9BILA